MTTGNKIVDEISALHINSIPEAWYRTVVRNNQPHAMAILVLWDLVYWYKWTEVRDEESGMVVSYKKKFKADLLQRSYDAIATKFGISKRQATDIVVFLEKLGALKRVFRNIKVANTTLSNVLFIELVPSVIKELSHVELGEVSQFDGRGSHADSGEGLTDLRETYTTSSTTNTTNNTNSLSTSLKSEPPKFNPSSTIKKTSSRTKKTKNEMYEEYLSSLSQEERDESAKCVDMFIELHKHLDSCYNRDKNRPAWQVDFAKYHIKSTRLFSQIQAVMKYGMNDKFWKTRLSSPTVLFRAFETILQQSLETSPSYKSNRQKQIDDTLSRVNRDTGKSDYNKSIW